MNAAFWCCAGSNLLRDPGCSYFDGQAFSDSGGHWGFTGESTGSFSWAWPQSRVHGSWW